MNLHNNEAGRRVSIFYFTKNKTNLQFIIYLGCLQIC